MLITPSRSTHPRSDPRTGQSEVLTSERRARRVARSYRTHKNPIKAVPPPAEDQQERVEYNDSWTDLQFINMCRKAYGNLAGWQSPREWQNGEETYQGMIEVSRALMKVLILI